MMGLRGTGSKDVVIDDVFVPDHRVSEASRMYDGSYARERRPDSPLFPMMFGLMFPAAIAAGTFGVARDAMRAFGERMEGRVSVAGHRLQGHPARADGLACAEADVEASISHFRSFIADLYDLRRRRGRDHPQDRLRFRRRPGARDRPLRSRRSTSCSGSWGPPRSDGRSPRAVLARPARGLHPRVQQQRADYQAWGLDAFGGPIPPSAQY